MRVAKVYGVTGPLTPLSPPWLSPSSAAQTHTCYRPTPRSSYVQKTHFLTSETVRPHRSLRSHVWRPHSACLKGSTDPAEHASLQGRQRLGAWVPEQPALVAGPPSPNATKNRHPLHIHSLTQHNTRGRAASLLSPAFARGLLLQQLDRELSRVARFLRAVAVCGVLLFVRFLHLHRSHQSLCSLVPPPSPLNRLAAQR